MLISTLIAYIPYPVIVFHFVVYLASPDMIETESFFTFEAQAKGIQI